MTHESKKRCLTVLEMIERDCEADAMSLDGTPFDRRNVAKRLGEMYATMKALATIQRKVIENKDALAEVAEPPVELDTMNFTGTRS